jgi:hypothetical protein
MQRVLQQQPWWRWVGVGVALTLLLGFVLWAQTGPTPMAEAIQALASGDRVTVEDEPWPTFRPLDGEPGAGLVFYPGGRVDPRAYAPQARAIAEAGYMVVIVPMPLNLAAFGSNRASQVMAYYPEVERWAVGGHSLGGAMAARYAHRHPDLVEGLVLWAAYPAAGDDLSGYDLAVVSIYGTRDGLATPERVRASTSLLPEDARLLAIEDGNHAGFGWYGPQAGDNEAAISRSEQMEQTVAATVALLQAIE